MPGANYSNSRKAVKPKKREAFKLEIATKLLTLVSTKQNFTPHTTSNSKPYSKPYSTVTVYLESLDSAN